MKLFLISILILISGILTSCVSVPTADQVKQERIALYWESTTEAHPERKPWSDTLTAIIRADLALYSKAKDIKELCPRFESLSEDGQVKAISEFWVAMAYFESGFNPKSNSVDVGTKDDLGSYSVGLYQMSANDNAAKKYGATFKTLQDPIVNIKVATEQMRRQINKCGEIFLPNSSSCRYWAVALEGNKHSKINDYMVKDKKTGKVTGPFPGIKSRVLKYAPECR